MRRVAAALILSAPLALTAQGLSEDRALARALGGFIIYGTILVLALLVFRGIALWYWKINTIERLLSEILITLRASAPRPAGVPLEPARFTPAGPGTGVRRRISPVIAAVVVLVFLALLVATAIFVSR